MPAIQARLDKINGMVTKATKEQEEFENSVRFHTEEALQVCAVMSLELFGPACVRCFAELHRHCFYRCSELFFFTGCIKT